MPELPEVETIRRTLLPRVAGVRFAAVELRRGDVVRHLDEHGRARRLSRDAARRALLEGCTVADVRRHGKQLALFAESGEVLLVQLGMSGRLLVVDGPERPRHAHCVWALAGGASLVFEDPRRFGGLTTLPSVVALDHRWAGLGPDALHVDGPALSAALGDSRRPVKAGLLDQHALAGVGNIYADEALFLAGVAPARGCHRLTPQAWDRVAASIRDVLAAAIQAGGSTVRDYRDARGESGRHQDAHAVYGRAGKGCPRCGRVLRRRTIAQRTTVWCPACQTG